MRCGGLLAFIWIICCHAADEVTQWATTIDVAGRQRMLTQKVTKELLLVHVGLDIDANTKAMRASAKLFTDSLQNLIDGNKDLNIIPSPTPQVEAGLEGVKRRWDALIVDMETSLTQALAGQPTDFLLLESIEHEELLVLKESNEVVGLMMAAARALGIYKIEDAVDIAARQRMLIQRICKEALLISLGLNPTLNAARLEATVDLFQTSHDGVLHGATWSGVKRVSAMCTLRQMRVVTHYWSQQKSLLGEAVSKATEREVIQQMATLLPEIVRLTDILKVEQQSAVVLFIKDEGLCDPIADMVSEEWVTLVSHASTQLIVADRVMMLFLKVANGVMVDSGKVELMVGLADAVMSIQNLIEGNYGKGLPSPPTQALVSSVLATSTAWNRIETTMTLAQRNDDFGVAKAWELSRYSDLFDKQMSLTTQMIVDTCYETNASLPVYMLMSAGRQRSLIAKTMKHAWLLKLDLDYQLNWEGLNATRTDFKNTFWGLLRGDSADPRYNKTTDVCMVKQMMAVFDKYQVLESTALKVARGDSSVMVDLHKHGMETLEAAAVSFDHYKSLSASCATGNNTFEGWVVGLSTVSDVRYLVAASFGEYLHRKSGFRSFSDGEAASQERVDDAIRKITYGSTQDKIPTPISQEMLDVLFRTEAGWEDLIPTFTQGDVPEVLSGVDRVVAMAGDAQDYYEQSALAAGSAVPTHRLRVAGNQLLLIQKMTNEVLLQRLEGFARNDTFLRDAIREYESAHAALRYGGPGLQAIIRQRGDLLQQMYVVDQMWTAFKPTLMSGAASFGNMTRLLGDKDELINALSEARDLFGIPDPYVPPEVAVFPIAVVIVPAALVYVCIVTAFTAWKMGGCRKKNEKPVPSDAMAGGAV